MPEWDATTWNTMLTGYSLQGNLVKAEKIFQEMPEKVLVSWTAMLTAYAQHGQIGKSKALFEEMPARNLTSDSVAFVSLLLGFSHRGDVYRSWKCFRSMVSDFGLSPGKQHFSCMVDALGRAGYLWEAQELIACMPVLPDPQDWTSLLAACKTHGDCEVGTWAAEEALKAESGSHGASYVLLANLFKRSINRQ
ncbi:hypothetical protein SELMODRAFT_100651 [Selaginella moellendorffii]|uniref:Pentacotripeptide-repeat region of PRORP domain-containing protein n=1 Tax=Selaginella moellendorffii TaxID=88036 RepID=D8RSD3_SELML|nr:hypothetical protein SELMODRAFT_100651 [Selaginella moellendorffii]